jgi:hypothetical protein
MAEVTVSHCRRKDTISSSGNKQEHKNGHRVLGTIGLYESNHVFGGPSPILEISKHRYPFISKKHNLKFISKHIEHQYQACSSTSEFLKKKK